MTTALTMPSRPQEDAATGLRQATARRRRRQLVVGATLTVLTLVVAIANLMLGEYRLSVGQVVTAVLGSGEPAAQFVVVGLRLPRMVLGLLVGAAFGLSGALFQAVLRNPLASPDIIGISQGASVGAVTALLVLGATGTAVSLSALAGGAAVGLLLYVVAWRQGMGGLRFVLSGIGVAYLCTSLLGYLLTRSNVREAQVAIRWMVGSLGQAAWDLVVVLGICLAVLVPLVAVVSRGLRMLLLGDESAAALGVRVEVVRVCVIALGVALAAVGTAAAGPIAFVALTAAPISRRLLDDGSPGLVSSALVGVVLVLGGDVVAQHLLPADMSVPVGIVTGVMGGGYLIWLLTRSGYVRGRTG